MIRHPKNKVGEPVVLDFELVRYWDLDGGTRLGSSRTNPFNPKEGDRKVDVSDQVIRNMEKLKLDALIPIGGEDTLGVAAKLAKKGVHVVGAPKTIDKDLGGTDYTLGFDTSMRTCADIIERSRTPAGSHHWVQVVEVMGRTPDTWPCGGARRRRLHHADSRGAVRAAARAAAPRRAAVEGQKDRQFPRYAVVVVSEGALPKGGQEVTSRRRWTRSATRAWAASAPGWRIRSARTRSGIRARWRSAIRSAAACRRRSIAYGAPVRHRRRGALHARRVGQDGLSARGVAPACDIGLQGRRRRKGLKLVEHEAPLRFRALSSLARGAGLSKTEE